MEGEFTFKSFGEYLAADAVDLEGTCTRRLDYVIDAAGEGTEQPGPRAFREVRGSFDGPV